MPKAAVARDKSDSAKDWQNLQRLLAFDRQQRFKGRSRKPQCFLVGTDEVGRGCFAGPVVAAAVMLPEFDQTAEIARTLSKLNDSKLINPAERERLSAIIHEIAVCAIDQASVEEINEINILHASLLAMKRALDKLSERIPDSLPVLVLVDGNKAVKNLENKYVQSTVVNGDATSASIAAASIIAKVFRDRIMTDLATVHPQYAWERNKGYGSQAHRDAIKTHGMTIWHRRVFCENMFNSTCDTDDDASDRSQELDRVPARLLASK
ncbi:MAG TPA: ribonuclease HII [Trichormus sp.]|jgi:ribonuclease HII